MRVAALLALTGCGSLGAYNYRVAEPSAAELQRYQMVDLELRSIDDVDGDGQIDNQLVNAIDAVDVLLADDFMSLDAFNGRLVEVLHMPDNELLVDVTDHGPAIELMVHAGGRSAALDGTFVAGDTFFAGPADLTFQVVALVDAPPVDVPLREATVMGELEGDTLAGDLVGIVPLETVLVEVIEPMLVPWDLNGDGVAEPVSEVRDLVWEVAPGLADTTLSDGTPGVTTWLSFAAERID